MRRALLKKGTKMMEEAIIEIPSPTEIVTDMEAENAVVEAGIGDVTWENNPDQRVEAMKCDQIGDPVEDVRRKKRERERRSRGGRADMEVKEEEEEDGEVESPSKRANARDAKDGEAADGPISGKELRYLFAQHLQSVKQELQSTWGDVRGRLESVEAATRQNKEQMSQLGGRMTVAEKDNVLQQRELSRHKERIDDLDGAVEELKKQMEEVKVQVNERDKQSVAANGARGSSEPHQSDPWAMYLRQQRASQAPLQSLGDQQMGGNNASRRRLPNHGGEPDREGLSEEDKRTLIIGGWLQDTKKEVIETEAQTLLGREEIKALLDTDKVTVYGPRKSFGVIKFKEREGENYYLVKERMWGVIKIVNALKHVWPSSAQTSQKPAWTSFMKTRGARQRTAHASMLRRVAIELSGDAKGENGTPKFPEALLNESYDVDWAAGTTWRQQWKLGSATHRQPKGGDVKLMAGGWVDLAAMTEATGATLAEVTNALERELNL